MRLRRPGPHAGSALAAILACALLAAPAARSQEEHAHHGGMPAPPVPKDCPDASLACAVSATPFFTPDGTLYVAWSAGGRIVMARSTDKGAHFGSPVFVNPAREVIDAGPDSRPSIVVDAQGRVTVAYAIFRNNAYDGEVRITRAEPGGSFPPATAIAENPASQRFQSLTLDDNGDIFAAWLDKRGRTALANPRDYVGAGLAWTWIGQDGTPQRPAHIAQDNTCECCRLGVAFAAPGRPVLLFRNVFPGSIRDHAIIAFQDHETPGPLHRVAEDDWMITACPHHGPALAIDGEGGWHAAWFTGGRARKGSFYAHSFDQGASFSEPMQLGSLRNQSGRPTLLARGDTIWLAWKEFDGDRSVVRLRTSQDRGQHFTPPRAVATTEDGSDHPILIAAGDTPYLSWLSEDEGYRLIPLELTQ